MACVPGWVSEKYRVLEKLGSGHYGRVYEIVPKKHSPFSSSQISVCKVLKARPKDSREAEIMKKLKGVKGVVSLQEYYEDSVGSYLIMERCECDLLSALKKGLIPAGEHEAARVILKLARTIKLIHSQGIVHRDLKAENVLVTKTREFKVADFGTATYCQAGEKLSEIAGTMGFVAPEVYRGSYSKEVDVYNLGLILFILVERSYPYTNISTDMHETNEFLRGEAMKNVDIAARYLQFEQSSNGAEELILKMTTGNPTYRVTIDQVLRDPWLQTKAKQLKHV